MKTTIDTIDIDTEADRLVESHDGQIFNGLSATQELRETDAGVRYRVVRCNPEPGTRIELERNGIRWTWYAHSGSVEGVVVATGEPVEPQVELRLMVTEYGDWYLVRSGYRPYQSKMWRLGEWETVPNRHDVPQDKLRSDRMLWSATIPVSIYEEISGRTK